MAVSSNRVIYLANSAPHSEVGAFSGQADSCLDNVSGWASTQLHHRMVGSLLQPSPRSLTSSSSISPAFSRHPNLTASNTERSHSSGMKHQCFANELRPEDSCVCHQLWRSHRQLDRTGSQTTLIPSTNLRVFVATLGQYIHSYRCPIYDLLPG